MTWIQSLPPEQATAELGELYQAIGKARGGVAEIHQAQSLNPPAMKAHLELYKAVMFRPGPLSRAQRERIGVVVSVANHCAYCVTHHSEALKQLGADARELQVLKNSEIPPALPAADQALLRWANRRSRQPEDSQQSDIEQLRVAGLGDDAILAATLVVAYFNFVNRLVLLLGVEIESNHRQTCG